MLFPKSDYHALFLKMTGKSNNSESFGTKFITSLSFEEIPNEMTHLCLFLCSFPRTGAHNRVINFGPSDCEVFPIILG